MYYLRVREPSFYYTIIIRVSVISIVWLLVVVIRLLASGGLNMFVPKLSVDGYVCENTRIFEGYVKRMPNIVMMLVL